MQHLLKLVFHAKYFDKYFFKKKRAELCIKGNIWHHIILNNKIPSKKIVSLFADFSSGGENKGKMAMWNDPHSSAGQLKVLPSGAGEMK